MVPCTLLLALFVLPEYLGTPVTDHESVVLGTGQTQNKQIVSAPGILQSE